MTTIPIQDNDILVCAYTTRLDSVMLTDLYEGLLHFESKKTMIDIIRNRQGNTELADKLEKCTTKLQV